MSMNELVEFTNYVNGLSTYVHPDIVRLIHPAGEGHTVIFTILGANIPVQLDSDKVFELLARKKENSTT